MSNANLPTGTSPSRSYVSVDGVCGLCRARSADLRASRTLQLHLHIKAPSASHSRSIKPSTITFEVQRLSNIASIFSDNAFGLYAVRPGAARVHPTHNLRELQRQSCYHHWCEPGSWTGRCETLVSLSSLDLLDQVHPVGGATAQP